MDTQPPSRLDPARPPEGTAYTALFHEDWNLLCPASSMAAVDSPVAYLQALYRFALQLEKTGKGHRPKITLDHRRPDLKALQIDEQSLTALVPQLTIVNQTLAQHLDAFLTNTPGVHRGRTRDDVLGKQRYPLLLPFDLAHRQCWLSLTDGKPPLGELSYRISLKLPLTQRPENTYGVVSQQAFEAQRLLSGLSPAQQNLLTEAFSERPGPVLAGDFFTRHYGSDEHSLKGLQHWLHRTELTAEHTEALLACGRSLPVLSGNVSATALPASTGQPPLHTGAAYVNGPVSAEAPAGLGLAPDENGVTGLQNTSWNRFQRLHRMIRLQRWLQIPFDQLDTLLVSIARSEQQADPGFPLNDNTLRALGVFRYLERRYSLQPEAFCALLHEIPVHAPCTRVSLYDQVFNHTPLAGQPLRVDQRMLALQEPLPEAIRHRLCAGLGLRDTPDSLLWVVDQARQHLPPACPTLTVFGALYRQARIARMFGVSVIDAYHLAHLLGGTVFCKQLVAPHLRPSGGNAPADLLDVLMQMDWLVTWLKDTEQSVDDLRRQLVLDPMAQPPLVQGYLAHLNELVELTRQGLLQPSDLDELALPQPEPATKAAPIQWHAVIVHGILRSHPSLRPTPPKELPKGLVDLIEEQTLSLDPARNNALHDDARQAITKKLGEFYQQLQPLKGKIEAFFSSASHAAYDPALVAQSIKHTARQLARAASAESSTSVLKNLLLTLPDAESFLGLAVSRQVLHTFLQNPEWLNSDQGPGSVLKLTLHTVYLLRRFHDCLDTYGLSQDTVLGYFQHAHSPSTPDPAHAHHRLATMLGWTPGEVKQVIERLPGKRVHTLAHLDWLMRCRETARLTGLSAETLLQAADLPAAYTSEAWKQVGAALMAAPH
ncbi:MULTISPECIES: Tc toxin subunit A [unclassified Pseudomonas]|uniref:Tc toxin subunit A n=1 Tax=unclassified Pseudomonas TaxID=196821 RepID=UPI0015A28F0D|nr:MULTISPECIES: Tc toxin subunit A [unclassified Pseudomonas]NWC93914.1 toxin [Pseudomonas sp. IPO3779]NWD21147.1 toxin [Pseudomonas sp. IPO3778]